MKLTLRAQLRAALKRTKGRKTDSVLKLLGCTLDELRTHLESNFTHGMTWLNYGKWHIDHRVALATIDPVKNLKGWNKLWHWTNLQPLWAIDNIKKGWRY